MFALFCVALILVYPIYAVYKPPSLLIRYFEHRWPNVLWRVPTTSKIVALTIDDAPSEYTQEILSILKEHDAAATFFIIGSQAQGQDGILQDIIGAGNELANHAMRDEPSRALTDTMFRDQLQTVKGMLDTAYAAKQKDSPPRYFRPGSGFFSGRMLKSLRDLDYRLVLGNIYPHDPQIPYWRVNARHILSMLQPGGIIICHDRRGWTPPMLRKVLPEIKSRGFQVTTISGLLEAGSTKLSQSRT